MPAARLTASWYGCNKARLHHSMSVVTSCVRRGGYSVMLLDHRTYTVRAGALRKQLALYEKHGLAHQKRHFGEPLAWLVSETGDVNSYVHIWVYEDAEDRNRKRAALMKDAEWLKYIEMNAEAGYLLKQESKLM